MQKMKNGIWVWGIVFCFSTVFAQSTIVVHKKENVYKLHSDSLGDFYSLGINAFFRKWDNEPLKVLFSEKNNLEQLYQVELQRLRELGFNTLGGWSSRRNGSAEFVYGKVLFDYEDDVPFGPPLLDIYGHEIGPSPVNGELKVPLSDPYDVTYQQHLDLYIKNNVVEMKDPNFLCYWLGNEFGFGDTEAHDFSNYLNSSGVQRVYIDWLKRKYKDSKYLNKVWGTDYKDFKTAAKSGPKQSKKEKLDRVDFAVKVLRDWFALVVQTIKKYDPKHLICSPRMNSWAMAWKDDEDQYISKGMRLKHFSALKGFVDVLSFNIYSKKPTYPDELFKQLEKVSQQLQLPILISEFGTRENISGWNNKPGAKTLVPNQKTRALYYESQVNQLLSKPYIIGAHWFKWSDHFSKKHQFNKGIIYVKDGKLNPYIELTKSMKKTNMKY